MNKDLQVIEMHVQECRLLEEYWVGAMWIPPYCGKIYVRL